MAASRAIQSGSDDAIPDTRELDDEWWAPKDGKRYMPEYAKVLRK